MICSSCGKEYNGKRLPHNLCQSCYTYFRLGGKIYDLPEKGCIGKTEKDQYICHICGKAYNVLGGHVRGSHQMTIKEYKERFGLCNNSHLTNGIYHQKMRHYALHYKMDIQLQEAGENTRIGKVPHLRLGKKSRLQECLAKRARAHK